MQNATMGQIPQLVIKTPNNLPAKCDNGLGFFTVFYFTFETLVKQGKKGQRQRDFGIVLMASHLDY